MDKNYFKQDEIMKKCEKNNAASIVVRVPLVKVAMKVVPFLFLHNNFCVCLCFSILKSNKKSLQNK